MLRPISINGATHRAATSNANIASSLEVCFSLSTQYARAMIASVIRIVIMIIISTRIKRDVLVEHLHNLYNL